MDKVNFETSIKRLEDIVRELERGDAPLERSLALFEEGAGLAEICGGILGAAEQKVAMLTAGGAEEERDFDVSETM